MWGLGTRKCEIDGRRWPSLAPLVIRVSALDYRDPPLRAKKVLLARRNSRTSHLYMGGLGRPQIRILRLLRQLNAGIAHTMPSLRALRGKNHWMCGSRTAQSNLGTWAHGCMGPWPRAWRGYPSKKRPGLLHASHLMPASRTGVPISSLSQLHSHPFTPKYAK